MAKKEYTFLKQDTNYTIELQYKNQHIDMKFPDEQTRDRAYEKAKLLIVPPKEEV